MNVSRKIGMTLSVGLLTLILSQFQNCAPPQEPSFYGADSSNGEIRVIDRWSDQKIEFVQTLVVLSSDEPTSVQGLCVGNDSDDPIKWEIIENSSQIIRIDSGIMECERGEFTLDLFNVSQLKCDVEYQVFAQGADGESSATTFLKRYCDESNSSI